MRSLNGFLGIIVLLVVFRLILPTEVGNLAGEILVTFLELIRDLLSQASLP